MAACSKGESPFSNIDLPDDGGPKPPVNTNKNTPIIFENSTFSGSVLVTFTDNTKEEVRFENGKGTVPLSLRADKTIASLQPENEALILIGRKEKSEIRLNYSNGTLSHRMAIDGFVPIGSYAEFQLIGKDAFTLANSYQLEDDLDLMSVEWVPLGKTNAPFKGNFDGDHHQLDNLKISVSADDGVTASIFGTLGGTETNFIKNIIVKSGEIKARYAATIAGGLRATAHTIENCINHIPVTGGLAGAYGIASSGRVVNCRNFGTITGIVAEGIGGTTIFDSVNEGEISAEYAYGIGGGQNVKNCINKGNITGSLTAAGIGSGTIVDCINEGEIVGVYTSSGIGEGNIKNCTNKGKIIGGAGASGIAETAYNLENCVNEGDIYSETGYACGIGRGHITDCANKGNVTGGISAAGIISASSSHQALIVNCINEGDINGKTDYAAGIVIGKPTAKKCINKGNVTGVKGVAGISTAGNYNVSGSYAEDCINEGDISGQGEQIGGILDRGIAINCVNKGKITVLGDTEASVGGIVGNGAAEKCVNEGEIQGAKGNTGGVVGLLDGVNSNYGNGTKGENRNTGTVKGSGIVGGVVGSVSRNSLAETAVYKSSNEGEIRGLGEFTGGVIGYIGYSDTYYGVISGCSNTGDIYGNGKVGGITSYLQKGYILSGTNRGKIVGGSLEESHTGGIAGEANKDAYIVSSFNTGEISGGKNVGGIVGSGGGIYGCYNAGKISGSVLVGGISGRLSLIQSCYNKGVIQAVSQSGGIAGEGTYEIRGCYNIGEIKGDPRSGNGPVAGVIPHNSTSQVYIENYYFPSSGIRGNGISAFSASDWPTPQINSSYKLWVEGEGVRGYVTNYPVYGYWKSLGSWNNGEPIFPKLHFENDEK